MARAMNQPPSHFLRIDEDSEHSSSAGGFDHICKAWRAPKPVIATPHPVCYAASSSSLRLVIAGFGSQPKATITIRSERLAR